MKHVSTHSLAASLLAGTLLVACSPSSEIGDTSADTVTPATIVADSGETAAPEPETPATEAEADKPVQTASVDDKPVPSTIKPGADVRITGAPAGSLAAGQSGRVELTINEAYDDGVMKITVSGSPGLNVLGTSGSTQMQMAGRAGHSWPVTVSADADGVYFLNIQVEAVTSDGVPEIRAFAVRVPVGDTSAATASKVQDTVEVLPDGETVIVLPAEETIE